MILMARHDWGKVIRLVFILSGACLVGPRLMYAQRVLSSDKALNRGTAQAIRTCGQAPRLPQEEALRLVCIRDPDGLQARATDAIVIGFVGGFVRRNNEKHPEVLFAAYLREHYPSTVHAQVFANHEGSQALRWVDDLLDTDHDGQLTSLEKERAKIIIYGHSWGASQAVNLAWELERQGIPVLLTIQVDSIHKPGQNDSRIPANVASAINFYQPRGLLHGRARIRPDDASRTKILGNYRMTYDGRRIDCSNYPWLVRTLNKPHHEIENDPRVWDQIASLIDAQLAAQ